MGIVVCLLISLYVADEFSFDRFNTHADRIVRVIFRGTVKGGKMNEAHVMPPVAATMKAELAEVQETARLRQGGSPAPHQFKSNVHLRTFTVQNRTDTSLT